MLRRPFSTCPQAPHPKKANAVKEVWGLTRCDYCGVLWNRCGALCWRDVCRDVSACVPFGSLKLLLLRALHCDPRLLPLLRDVNAALNILWIAMHALLGVDRPRYLTKEYGNAAPSASRDSDTGDGPPPQSGAASRRKPRSGRPAGRKHWEDEDNDEVEEEQQQLTREQQRQRVREQEQLEREERQQARERQRLARAERAQHRG